MTTKTKQTRRTTPRKETNDGVAFKKNGTVQLTIDGEVITLTAPKFGEFKAIKRLMFENAEELEELAKEKKVDLADLAMMNLSGVSPGVEVIIDKAQELAADVIAAAVDMLGDKPLPEDRDEWPLWLVSSDNLLTDLMVHWKTVPLDRG